MVYHHIRRRATRSESFVVTRRACSVSWSSSVREPPASLGACHNVLVARRWLQLQVDDIVGAAGWLTFKNAHNTCMVLFVFIHACEILQLHDIVTYACMYSLYVCMYVCMYDIVIFVFIHACEVVRSHVTCVSPSHHHHQHRQSWHASLLACQADTQGVYYAMVMRPLQQAHQHQSVYQTIQ